MSVFYLLPTRRVIAADFARYLDAWLPGVMPAADVADRLAEMVQAMADNFVVFADDLPTTDGLLTTHDTTHFFFLQVTCSFAGDLALARRGNKRISFGCRLTGFSSSASPK